MPMSACKGIITIFLLTLLVSTAGAQRVLLVEKPGTFRNYKYFVGDEIMLRTWPSGLKHGGIIHEITDTSILINFDEEIMIADIEKVLRHRWALGLTSKATRIAGAGYVVLDVVNNAINNEEYGDDRSRAGGLQLRPGAASLQTHESRGKMAHQGAQYVDG